MPDHPVLADSPAFVGIFWAVQEKAAVAPALLDHRCALSDAECYGSMLTCGHGHYEIWEKWRTNGGNSPVVAMHEYEELPRGRVVFDPAAGHFVIYADAQILNSPDLLRIIHKRFLLPTHSTKTKSDNHYISTLRFTTRSYSGESKPRAADPPKTRTRKEF